MNVPKEVAELYEVHDFGHASAILTRDFEAEYSEICAALLGFRFTDEQLKKPGGNESDVPKVYQKLLEPAGWREVQLNSTHQFEERVFKTGTRLKKRKGPGDLEGSKTETRHSDTHKIDFLKGRLALDVEWNSKDQTFDRDLYAFRAFWEFGRISAGIIITRGTEMFPYLKGLGIGKKYGASTTHMGKLLPRLRAGRQGGCPVLVFGITPRLKEIVDAG